MTSPNRTLPAEPSGQTKAVPTCDCTKYNGGQCYNCLNGGHEICDSGQGRCSRTAPSEGMPEHFTPEYLDWLVAKLKDAPECKANGLHARAHIALDTLRRHAEQLAEQVDGLKVERDMAYDAVKLAESRLMAAEKNAKRYEWLRDKRISGNGLPHLAYTEHGFAHYYCGWDSGQIDAAIDAALPSPPTGD